MGSERSEGHAPLVARVAEGRLLDGVKVTEVLAPPNTLRMSVVMPGFNVSDSPGTRPSHSAKMPSDSTTPFNVSK